MPIDFSVCSIRALRYGEELARRFGAEIVLLHVDQPLVLESELAETRRSANEEELEALVALLRDRGIRARSVVCSGGPAEQVMKAAAAEHADLIVMGTHGRTGLAHVLMGSVAESVVRRATCPVVTVRHATAG